MKPTRAESTECLTWSQAWHDHRAHSALESNLNRAGLDEEAFWSRYSAWVAAMRGDYPGALLERVRTYATPGGSLLDIGAGAGAFAFPLAAVSRRVTAVEPSPAQVTQLTRNIARSRTNNITIVPRRWEDVDLQELGAHDLVLAVHSLQMDDIAAALRKMCAAASRCLLLVHTAGHSLSRLSRELFDIEPGPDYTYLEHILLGLGYDPRVEFVDYGYDVPMDIQQEILRYNPGLNAEQCAAFRDYVESHDMTARHDGVTWVHRSCRDALVSVTSNQ